MFSWQPLPPRQWCDFFPQCPASALLQILPHKDLTFHVYRWIKFCEVSIMIPLLRREVETWSRLTDIFTLCKARPRARTLSCISDSFAWTRRCVFLTYSAALDDFPLCCSNAAEEQVFPLTLQFIKYCMGTNPFAFIKCVSQHILPLIYLPNPWPG